MLSGYKRWPYFLSINQCDALWVRPMTLLPLYLLFSGMRVGWESWPYFWDINQCDALGEMDDLASSPSVVQSDTLWV